MSRLIITHQGTVIKEFDLTKNRTTVGRKPHNDIVLDDPTVSGEHAAFLFLQNMYIEDLNSTNGVLLNGKKVSKRQLNHGDVVRIGQHELKFIDEKVQDFESTVIIGPDSKAPVTAAPAKRHFVVMASGAKKGEKIILDKPYTRLGSASEVAVVARRGSDYYLMPMSGTGVKTNPPKLNGEAVAAESMKLKNGDLIEVAGIQLKYTLE